MSEATSLLADYEKVVNKYGGSILVYGVTSGLPSVWGDVTSASKHVGSSFFIGMIQEAKKVLNYKEFGSVSDNDSICFAKSGLTFNLGDKIKYQDINYEVASIHIKTVSDKVIYQKLLLTHMV